MSNFTIDFLVNSKLLGLQELVLRRCRVDKVASNKLAKFLTLQDRLERLDLSNNNVEGAFRMLLDALMKRAPELRSLSFAGNNLQHVENPSRALANLLNECKKLERLDLGGTQLILHANKHLGGALSRHPSLRQLNVDCIAPIDAENKVGLFARAAADNKRSASGAVSAISISKGCGSFTHFSRLFSSIGAPFSPENAKEEEDVKDPQDAPDAQEKKGEEEEIKTGAGEAMSLDPSEGVEIRPF